MFKEGDRVIINDFSEAHGDKGVIWRIENNGIILVELDEEGCIWPVFSEDELKKIYGFEDCKEPFTAEVWRVKK